MSGDYPGNATRKRRPAMTVELLEAETVTAALVETNDDGTAAAAGARMATLGRRRVDRCLSRCSALLRDRHEAKANRGQAHLGGQGADGRRETAAGHGLRHGDVWGA